MPGLGDTRHELGQGGLQQFLRIREEFLQLGTHADGGSPVQQALTDSACFACGKIDAGVRTQHAQRRQEQRRGAPFVCLSFAVLESEAHQSVHIHATGDRQ